MSDDINSAGRSFPPAGEAELRVRRIQDKLQLLLRQRDLLQKENGRLKEDIRQLQEELLDRTTKLEQYQQQVEILKATQAAMSEEEKRALEKRLGQYIREIDRCIAMLGE
jgi:chromosome segregation ATPase